MWIFKYLNTFGGNKPMINFHDENSIFLIPKKKFIICSLVSFCFHRVYSKVGLVERGCVDLASRIKEIVLVSYVNKSCQAHCFSVVNGIIFF